MELIIVNNPTTEKAFIQLPVRLYKNDPNWIRPLDQDIQAVFDPQKNPNFQYGECIRWVLQDQGRVVGRVAAFFDRRITEKDNLQPTGGMGFFECVDNQAGQDVQLNTVFEVLCHQPAYYLDHHHNAVQKFIACVFIA